MCIISGSDLKVCQAFSIISPNPPPSQFATFPFAGSGKDYQADPLPFPILIFVTNNPKFYDQKPMCPIHDMCKNALLPGIWNFHCVFYLITLVDSEIRSKCNLHQESEYCIASPPQLHCNGKKAP